MTEVHPTSVVDDKAELGEGVVIGPYCTVGPRVTLGDGVRLISHVVVDGWTEIGARCTVSPFACVGTQTQDLKYAGAETRVVIGEETTLREYVTVNSGTTVEEVTTVGSNCHLMAYSHVAHGCVVGNEVIMANAATLAGHVVVEDQVIIGGLTGIHQFVTLGRLCILGGCTKIVQDCPPFMMIDGNPAAARGLNRIGLDRKGVPAESCRSLKEAYRILYRSGLTTAVAIEKIESDVEGSPELDHLVGFVRASKRGVVREGGRSAD